MSILSLITISDNMIAKKSFVMGFLETDLKYSFGRTTKRMQRNKRCHILAICFRVTSHKRFDVSYHR